MKQVKYWVCMLAGAALIGWSDAHTDEVPIVLGIILILSSLLGGVFPQRPWLTALFLGSPVFFVETLVHFSVIRAPYPPSAGLPWPALLAFIPAMGGAFLGSAVRRLNMRPSPIR